MAWEALIDFFDVDRVYLLEKLSLVRNFCGFLCSLGVKVGRKLSCCGQCD